MDIYMKYINIYKYMYIYIYNIIQKNTKYMT